MLKITSVQHDIMQSARIAAGLRNTRLNSFPKKIKAIVSPLRLSASIVVLSALMGMDSRSTKR